MSERLTKPAFAEICNESNQGKKLKLSFRPNNFLDTAIGPKSAWNAGNALKTPELFGLDGTIRHADSDKKIPKPFLL